jgi:hypothetical protein
VKWTLIVEKNESNKSSKEILDIYMNDKDFHTYMQPSLYETNLKPPMNIKLEYIMPEMKYSLNGIIKIIRKSISTK